MAGLLLQDTAALKWNSCNGKKRASYIRTYVRFYGSGNRVLWTGNYVGAVSNKRMYVGKNVKRISARTSYGYEPVSITSASGGWVKVS